MRRVACALVHHPVLDRSGTTVTAAITNIDLHDISRTSFTYGLEAFYAVHPVFAQRELALRIREHWVHGSGGQRIPDRKPALERLRVVDSLQAAVTDLGEDAQLWTTSAKRVGEHPLELKAARALLREPGPPVLIALGTGWGLAESVHAAASVHLEPIASIRPDGYNHLSVRAAAAILLDRLLGEPTP